MFCFFGTVLPPRNFFFRFFLCSFLALCQRVLDVGRPWKYFSRLRPLRHLGGGIIGATSISMSRFSRRRGKSYQLQSQKRNIVVCVCFIRSWLAFRCPLVCVCHGQQPNSRPPGSTILASTKMKMPSTDPPCGARPSRHSNLLQPNRPLIGWLPFVLICWCFSWSSTGKHVSFIVRQWERLWLAVLLLFDDYHSKEILVDDSFAS